VASYSIEIKRSAAKELAALPKRDRTRVITRIRSLADEPRPAGCEKLSGQERYRLHQGDYRILYEIADAVRLVKIGHRHDEYRA